MFPIRDHHPSGRIPLVNYFLILINILVFFYIFSLPESLAIKYINKYALIPAQIVQGQNLSTLVSSLFLHASWGHLLGNMLFLHIFGDNLEDRLGHIKFLVYYLLCGLGGSVLQIFLNPSLTIPNLGASGAIAGIMGGYFLLFPHHKIDVLFILGFYVRQVTVPAYFMLFYWFIAQVFYGVGSLALAEQATGGIAFFAHVGGFLTGFLLLLPKKYAFEES